MKKPKKINRLPDAELEIMQLLWQADGGVPRNYFDVRLKQSRGWADSTILSLLSRLGDKGFLHSRKEGNRNIYSPLISREEYLSVENASFLSRVHHSSLMGFVASMADGGNLKSEDIAELSAYLDTLKKRGE